MRDIPQLLPHAAQAVSNLDPDGPDRAGPDVLGTSLQPEHMLEMGANRLGNEGRRRLQATLLRTGCAG